MKFIELKNIERKDSPIHYINEYHCLVEYTVDDSLLEERIEVILEKTAFGATNIQLSSDSKLLNAHIKELKDFIDEKNKSGYFN